MTNLFHFMKGYENFKAIIERHPSSFQAGATFPDWGYPRNGYHSASELAHWVFNIYLFFFKNF